MKTMLKKKNLFTFSIMGLFLLLLSACGTASAGSPDATKTPGYKIVIQTHPVKKIVTLTPSTNPTNTPTLPGKTLLVYQEHTKGSPVIYSAWSPDGKLVASSELGGSEVRLWDGHTGKTVRTYKGMDGMIAWSHDGKRIAVAQHVIIGIDSAPIFIVDSTSDKTLVKYTQSPKAPADIAWSSDDKQIASLSADGVVQIWESSTGKLLKSYTAHRKVIDIGMIAWSADDTSIATNSTVDGNSPNEITIWNATSGKATSYHPDKTSHIKSLHWSSANVLISTNQSDDHSLKLWNVQSGKMLLSYTGHTADIISVAWSSDGKMLASAGEDKLVKVFDVNTGKTILTYSEHQTPVYSVSWSPESKLIASGDQDGIVRVWSV